MPLDKDFNLIVGLRIREIRESMDLSREKFSEKCDISASFLADVERGKKSITAKTIYKICNACDVSADYIVLGHKKGFDRDICIEVLNSFTYEQLEHITTILQEMKKLSNPNDN
jgi:transcriptional regulator with XRE-family HTH domain